MWVALPALLQMVARVPMPASTVPATLTMLQPALKETVEPVRTAMVQGPVAPSTVEQMWVVLPVRLRMVAPPQTCAMRVPATPAT